MAEWGRLGAISREAKEVAAQERRAPLVDCPICGEVLELNGRTRQRACPLGHYVTHAETKGEAR